MLYKLCANSQKENPNMKKKVFLIIGLILVLSSTLPIFAQVISPGPASWEPDLTSSGVAISEPFEGYLYDPDVVHGGTLTVATPSDPPELHQWNAGATASYDFLDWFNDYLTRTDPVTGAVVPWIAESWEVSEDKLSYVVHLAEGVKFHDGVELTAEDVKWNFDFIMENNFTRMSNVWQILSREKPTEIIDDYTLRFHVAEPYVPFPRNTLGNAYIYPKHIWEPIAAEPDFDWLTYVPSEDEHIGCGPFKFVAYVPNAWYKFESFDDYWHGKPYLDEVVRPIITSGDAELLAVKRGEVDIFTGFLASEAIPGLLREEGIGLYLYNNPYMYHWGMNTHKWPFSVKEFRFALANAIDKQDIVDTLLLGYGLPGTHGVEAPFYNFWFNPNVPETYSFNLNKSIEILDDLGWVDTDDDGVREGTGDHAGEPLAFDIGPPIYDPVRCRAAELLSEWFAQIGVDATVQYMEWATLWGKIIQPLDSPTKIDTWLLGSSQSPEPTWMHTRLHSDNIPNPNYYGFINAEYDELALLQGTQFDSSERQESIWRMQEILAEEVPLVVLYFRQSPSVYRNDELTGWIEHFGSGMDHFWNYINLRPIVEMKSMSVSVVSTPPPECEIGDDFTLGITYTGPDGPVTTASVSAMLTGDPTPYPMEHVGSGTYECDFDTSDWHEGDYTIRVEAKATGFTSELTTFAIESMEPVVEEPDEPEPPSFWESYGATVTGVVVVLAVVAVAAVYMYGRKS
jgi:peptide/nickel transport system substrate-binding protein